jgi:ferredoxin-thioredoxin reductase catalytic subunit
MGEMGGTAVSMGEKTCPCRLLVAKVYEDTKVYYGIILKLASRK